MIRIEANYPATDGSAPERIEITWEDVTPTGGDLAVLVEVLGRVAQRYEIPADAAGRPQSMMRRVDFDCSPDSGTEVTWAAAPAEPVEESTDAHD